MNKGIIIITAVVSVLVFISCENKQTSIEEQKTDFVVTNSTDKKNSLVREKDEIETTYFPAIERYLINEFGSKYLKGQYCVPFQTVIGVDERNSDDILVWGDFWVFNYNLDGDILKTVSGGSHPGLMHIKQTDKGFEIISFEQVEDGSRYLPSAKKIFGNKYEAFHKINSDENRREKHRAEVLTNYVQKHNIAATKYQDYGWPVRNLPFENKD